MSELFIHPGAVDLHDHFREPSQVNLAENFESGTIAAAIGGYVVVNDMPNTPGRETWTAERADEKHDRILAGSVIPTGIIYGMQPEADNVGQIPALVKMSVAGKQYYTRTQGNDRELGPEDFRAQTEAAHKADPRRPIFVHAGEDIEGIVGMIAVDNDHPLHFCHVNNPDDVVLINNLAKRYDRTITTGVTPHHLAKTSFDTFTEGWFARMKPELATQVDSEKLFHQLVNGDIDVVETDHAPHLEEANWKAEKQNPTCEEDGASCFGVENIEFALPLLFYQAKIGRISLERIIEVTSTKPAEIIGIRLSRHTSVAWDLSHEYRINDSDVVSGSGWTPFQGKIAVGKVVDLAVSGMHIIDEGVLNTLKKMPRIVLPGAEI